MRRINKRKTNFLKIMNQKEKDPAQQEVDPTLTPSEYFDKLKDAKQTITIEKLKQSYDVILKLADKYQRTGQDRSLSKLKFLAETLNQEEKLIPLGVTTFVYRDTIEDYIDNVANDVVKIIELSNYMREIPDEIVEVIDKTKDIFTDFYVVFTDYTGKEERRVEQQRRDKDPILFGCFKNVGCVADRFYFLGDWVDEYCDLTLDKLVDTYRKKKDGNVPTHEIETPQTSEELLELLKAYQPKKKSTDNNSFVLQQGISSSILENFGVSNTQKSKKTSFFDKVRSIFTPKKV